MRNMIQLWKCKRDDSVLLFGGGHVMAFGKRENVFCFCFCFFFLFVYILWHLKRKRKDKTHTCLIKRADSTAYIKTTTGFVSVIPGYVCGKSKATWQVTLTIKTCIQSTPMTSYPLKGLLMLDTAVSSLNTAWKSQLLAIKLWGKS